jgi:HKD family nuclease
MVFQPFKDDLCLYDALARALDDERLTELSVVVAWAKESGLQHIRSNLQAFRARGGKARILLGIDEDGATLEGLHGAISEFDEALVLFDRTSGTFHPKLYMVAGDTASIIIIGSNNLTRGGLFDNYETGTCFELDREEGTDEEIHHAVAGYIERLQHDKTSRPLTEELIPRLRDHFHIRSEKRRGKTEDDDDSRGGSRRSKDTSGLFGASQYKKKRIPPPYPTIKIPITPISDRKEVSSLGARKRGQSFQLPLPGGGAAQVPCEAVPKLIFWCWDTAKGPHKRDTFTTAARQLGVPAAAEWSAGYQYIGLNPEHRRGKPPPPGKLKIAAHLLDKLKHA